ncbi:MAG: O-succinylbenzoate-CoA ligase [Granulosicoccus sp.]|jgi:O-succinylbenzoate-CoA ligase
MKNNIGSLLAIRAGINSNREAFVDSSSGLRQTFKEMNINANKVANGLTSLGVSPGDRVALLQMNSAEFMESYFAVAKIGAVVVPLNWRLVADELEFILKDSGTTTLIFGEEFIDLVAEVNSREGKTDIKNWLQVSSHTEDTTHFSQDYATFRDAASDVEPAMGASDDDMLYIMYTSGTTGLPKGVVHTHNTTFWALLTFAGSTDLRDGDRYLAALPMFHVGALTPITLNVYRGVTSVVMREFDATRAWQLIEEEKINNALLVPAMLNFMIQVPDLTRFDYSTIRWIQSGASPLPVNLIEAYDAMNIPIHQIYGLTETCGPACVIDAENAIKKIGSTGVAFFHTQVRIVGEDGKDCVPGVQGEVLVSGRHIMKEYWNRPDATRNTLIDGWLKTGDVACMDEDGFVYIQDRIKDMIISGGENVYPAEIENVIVAHPSVAEVAVIGQPSERWGESPFAVIVTKEGQTLSAPEVLQFCDGKLARFKLPKGAVFIDTIPRNPSGKVLKRILREQYPGPAAV